jgi:hypothetical protein
MVSYELPLIIRASGHHDRRIARRRDRRRPGGLRRSASCRAFGSRRGAAAFILFFVSGLVESNRTPFVPEGESEIVAGHMTGIRDSLTRHFPGGILWNVRH